MDGRRTESVIAAVSCCSGGRKLNQDNFLLGDCYREWGCGEKHFSVEAGCEGMICSVCDGMGGMSFGEEAALYAVKALKKYSDELRSSENVPEAFSGFIKKLSRSINKLGQEKGRQIGAAIVIAYISHKKLYICSVGDCRAYLLGEGNELKQLTTDHTVEQDMGGADGAKSGKLTQYLGMDEDEFELEPCLICTRWEKNQSLLLCSDGVTQEWSDADIQTTLKTLSAETAVRILTENATTSTDNATALVILKL